MGLYLEPTNCSKFEWVSNNAVSHFSSSEDPCENRPAISQSMFKFLEQSGTELCVLVDNGAFQALGVLFNYPEYEAFAGDRSGRPMWFFTVNRPDVEALAPNLKDWKV